MCVCVQIYTCKCRCQQRPEEGIRSPGVTGSCKQPHGVLGIGPLSAKGVHILYPWVISPTSTFCFLIRGNHREDVVKCTEDSRDFTMQTHWFHTQINRKLSEKSSFWLLTPPHIQIITRNYWHSIPREVIYLDSSPKPKFRENTKNLSYSLFIQMTLRDMDRDFRVKAWIRKSNGNEGGEDINTDHIQSFSILGPHWHDHTWSGKNPTREDCTCSGLCLYIWMEWRTSLHLCPLPQKAV